MSAQPIPTPRTDAELARLLTDFDLTNIDRREAMAEWARQLEKELYKLADRSDELLKASMADEREQVAMAGRLLIENRMLRGMVDAREIEVQKLLKQMDSIAVLAHEALKK